VLKDFGVVGKDGKLIQDIIVYLKKLLPSDLLKATDDFVAEASLPLRYGSREFVIVYIVICSC